MIEGAEKAAATRQTNTRMVLSPAGARAPAPLYGRGLETSTKQRASHIDSLPHPPLSRQGGYASPEGKGRSSKAGHGRVIEGPAAEPERRAA